MGNQNKPLFLEIYGERKVESTSEENNQGNIGLENNSVVDTLDTVRNEILLSVQKLLDIHTIDAINNSKDIDSFAISLESFGFNFEEHIVSEEIIENEKIIYKHEVSKEGEKILKSLLVSLKLQQKLQEEIKKDYNFSRLNKIITHSDKNFIAKDAYTIKELNGFLGEYSDKNTPKIIEQLHKDIIQIEKQGIYKENISKIILLLQTFSQLDSSSDLYGIYNNLLSESQRDIHKNFTTIRVNSEGINQEYIDEQERSKQQKTVDNIGKDTQKFSTNSKKAFSYKSIVGGILLSLTAGGYMFYKNDQEQSHIDISEIKGETSNRNKNIEKNSIVVTPEMMIVSDRIKIDNFIRLFMETLGSTNPNIHELKPTLAKGLRIFENNNELYGNNFNYNIGNSNDNTLIVSVSIDDKDILKNEEYQRSPIHIDGSREKELELQLEENIGNYIYTLMEQSESFEEFSANIPGPVGKSIEEVFMLHPKHFKLKAVTFGDDIYIKILEKDTNIEYNIYFPLASHL